MATKKTENKIILEREYIVPLRAGFLKVPQYRRGKKAVKTLKEFLAQHMKVYDRDLRKIKLAVDLNNEILFRGVRKPPVRIKVKAVKYEDGIVRVNLSELPMALQFKKAKQAKKEILKTPKKQKAKTIEDKQTPEEKKEHEEKVKDEKEKQASVAEENIKEFDTKAKVAKHTSPVNEKIQPRKTLSR